MTNMKKWETIHCFVMVGSGILFWFTHWGLLILLTAITSFVALLFSVWPALWNLHPFGGYANWVTFMRLSGLVVLFTLSGSLSYGQIAFMLLILILLDGIDGFLARRFHHVTSFGAVFDMETDAVYVCLASILLFEKGLAGGWILLVGFMRYFFFVLKYFMGLHDLRDKGTRLGPAIAAVLFVALFIPYILQRTIYFPCLIVASALVTLSFAWSFYLLITEKRKSSD